MKNENLLSTILIIVIVAGLLIVMNLIGGKGGCQGMTSKPDTTVQVDVTESNSLVEPVILENGRMKVRILSWDLAYNLRIDQVEMKSFTMNKSAKTTEKVPVRLLEATRFYDSTGSYLGTWDDDIGAKLRGGVKFKTATHAGYEITPSGSVFAGTLEKTRTSDSTISLVWKDSLGNSRKLDISLSGYELSLTGSDTLIPLRFTCQDGIKRSDYHDNSELTLYQVYYRPAGKNPEWFNAGSARKLIEGKKSVAEGPYEWIALRGKYFTSIILPSGPVDAKITPDVRSDQRIGLAFDAKQGGNFKMYFGPLDYKLLSGMNHRLGRIVELGGITYRWLSVGMLYIFQFLHRILGNYGVAIMLFALIIKLIFLPLSQSQQRSMRKMQVLQPKLAELQKRFKDDPQRLNEETMRLYRDHKASPLAGCLPVLIQMPVFFGLYAVLRNAVSLRGAPFVKVFTIHMAKSFDFLFIHIPAGNLVWLSDLSQRDPFFILPALMTVASIFQSLLTNADPRQRATAIIFPLLIAFVFLNFPSGLQLYWLVFNLLSLLEYWIFKRRKVSGEIQWQSKKPEEIPSVKSSPKSLGK